MGIRAEVRIDSPPSCPVAHVSQATGALGTSVTKTSASDSTDMVTEEFMLDSETSLESIETPEVDGGLEDVFSYGSKHTYRFRHPQGDCACGRIEQFECPITDVYARDGVLFVTFHTSDMEQLKRVLTDLRELETGVSVKRLLHATKEGTDNDLVLLDRSELTTRQREVLETAHEMGYFEHGQGANAGDVADALDINTSTFSEILRAAQRKLLKTILDG